jgi:hypothetical protein
MTPLQGLGHSLAVASLAVRRSTALSDTAGQLQTPTSGLVSPFEQISRLNQSQPKEARETDKGLLEAISNVVKGGQSERVDTAKMMEVFTKFLSNGLEKGIFGPDDFKALENIAPRTAAAIEDKLPKGEGSTFTKSQTLGAIRAAGPQIDANAVDALVLPDSIPTAWEKVKASYERLAVATTGGHALAKTLEGFASVIEGMAKSAETAQKAQEKFNPSGINRADTGPSSFQRPEFREGNAAKPPVAQESFTAFDAENTGRLTPEANKAADALSKLTDSTESLQERQDKFHITDQDALAAKGTDLALKQAAIDKKYEPQETASKLQHAEISLQSAVINLAQANINGLEAQKNQQLSALAPEEAQEREKSAESRLRKAEH